MRASTDLPQVMKLQGLLIAVAEWVSCRRTSAITQPIRRHPVANLKMFIDALSHRHMIMLEVLLRCDSLLVANGNSD